MLTIFKQKAEAARGEHASKDLPTQVYPQQRKVRLLIQAPPAQPEEEEGKDLPMAVDEEPEVSSAIIGPFLINFLCLKEFPKPWEAKGCQGSCGHQKAEELVRGTAWDCEAQQQVRTAP